MEPKLKDGQKDFKNYLPKLEGGLFSSYKPLDQEKMTAVELQKQKEEAKNKEKDEWKKKLVVDDPTLHVSLKLIGVQVLDKYKGILSDTPKKAGLKLPAKYIKDKIVTRDETIKELPISYNLVEDKMDKNEVEKRVRLDRRFNPKASMSKTDFDTVKAKNADTFVYKPTVKDIFAVR